MGWNTLLLANGASVNIWSGFSYKSKHERDSELVMLLTCIGAEPELKIVVTGAG